LKKIFFISEDDNEDYSDSDELSCLPPNRRHSTDFSGSARISGCRQLKKYFAQFLSFFLIIFKQNFERNSSNKSSKCCDKTL